MGLGDAPIDELPAEDRHLVQQIGQLGHRRRVSGGPGDGELTGRAERRGERSANRECALRLIEAVKRIGLSGREARNALATGKIRWRGAVVGDPDREVGEVAYDPRAPRTIPGRDPFVVHRDDDVVVVHKPARMLSVPAPGRREANLLEVVGRWFGSVYAVHRLDEETSGLMLVARSVAAQERLKSAFEVHDVERTYWLLANGELPSVRVSNLLVRDRGDGKRGSGEGGKPAVTTFVALEPLRGATFAEARLETGRTHQIRIHAAELGHPVLGDALYGGRGVAGRAPRVALHSVSIGFAHPASGQRLRFECPLPDDLAALRKQLGGTGPPR